MVLTTNYQRIGTSTYTVSGSNELRLYAKYNSQNITYNASSVTIQLRTIALNGNYYSSGNSSTLNCYGNRGTQYYDIGTVNTASEKVIGTWTFDLTHSTDGTLKNVGAGASANVFGSLNPYVEGYFDLPTIPRASGLSSKTGTIGSNMTITWNRASSNFTHTLSYSFGQASGVIGYNLTEGADWTPPISLYQYITNAKQGTGSLILQTYNGNTLIGTSTATLTLNANDTECLPIVEESNLVDIRPDTIALTGNENILVVNQSIGELSLYFSTKYKATIKSIIIDGSIDITSYAEQEATSSSQTDYSLNYDITPISKKTAYSIVITDSRGYTTTIEKTGTSYVDYVNLSSNLEMYRPQPTTGEIAMKFDGNYYNGSFGETNNELTIQYKYKKSTENAYSNLITLTLNTDYKIKGNTYHSGTNEDYTYEISLGNIFDYKYDYDFIFYYKDKLITTLSKNIKVSKGIPIFNWDGEHFNVNGRLTVNEEEISGGAGETLPVGSEIDFDGDTSDIPDGWEISEASNDYSTNETFTGSYWIDNKPIYRKVVNYTLTATSGYPSFLTGILNVDYMTIKISRHYGNSRYVSSTTSFGGYFDKTNGEFVFILGGTVNAEPGDYTFIFEYTKTTD